MADKIYPASKPTAVNGGAPSFPATKAQLYNTSRPVYRPQPRRSRRGCCCLCITFTILLLFIIAALFAGLFYLLYRPHRPSFSVSSLRLSQFNLTSSNQLTTKFNFTLTARNPNRKLVFYYDAISISINTNGVDAGDGSIPAFVAGKKNTTTLRTIVSTSGQSVDDDNDLKSNLKNRKSLPLKIQLDTSVQVKIGIVKTKRVPVRVICNGITVTAPTGKFTAAAPAATSEAKCKVDLRIKIWKWTI